MKCDRCNDKGYIMMTKISKRQTEGFCLPFECIAYKQICLCEAYKERQENVT